MSFDCSRFTFNPWNDYLGVVMQQGRVQLDEDWNEWLAELARRLQAGTLDTIGASAVPRAIPDSFKITSSTIKNVNHLSIGRGRIYVDGLLAENHGQPAPSSVAWTDGTGATVTPPTLAWDPALAELTGTGDTPYEAQPYYPNAPALPNDAGPHVVYLDVWTRELTHLQQPDLVEKAVGVDTAQRLQTVWQVKVLQDTGAGTTCGSDLSALLVAAGVLTSAARLTTSVSSVQSSTDPCQVPTTSGYKGLENQLYRIEIQQGGAQSVATFKWSRDNAIVATQVVQITAPDTLIVASVGKDEVLRFSPGDWIEITDDWQELAGLPGELHKIKTVQDATLTITLASAILTPTNYPVDNNLKTDPSRHTRIRRWDQQGKVLQSDNTTLYFDLDVAGSTGAIPVPPPGTSVILENGVVVSFDLDPSLSGNFQDRDFWCFAARASDGTVEKLTFAPPRGIHHHYTKLALVTFPTGVTSCRTLWPPLGANSGCCAVSIGPGDLTGTVTLQSIVDQYKQKPNTVICLQAGTYALTAPLRLTMAHSGITLKGCDGEASLTVAAGSASAFQDGMVVLDQASAITLAGISFTLQQVPFTAPSGLFAGLPLSSPGMPSALQSLTVSIGVRAVSSLALTITGCTFTFGAQGSTSGTFSVGVLQTGPSDGLVMEKNEFTGSGSFLAGYILAPSILFNPPPPPVPPRGIGGVRGPIDRARALAVGGETAAPAAGTAARVNVAALAPAAAPATDLRGAGQPLAFSAVAASDTLAKTLGAGLVFKNFPIFIPPFASFTAPAASVANTLKGFTTFTSPANSAAYGGSVLVAALAQARFANNTFSGMDVAVLVLAEAGEVTIIDNEVENGGAGFYLVAPADANVLAYDGATLLGAFLALGYPLPAGDASTLTMVAAAPAPTSVYAGKESYTDSQGNVWTPDVSSTVDAPLETTISGTLNQPSPPPAIANALPATSDQVLYQSERYAENFTYYFAVPDGFYQVTLKFSEIYHTDTSTPRVFNVSINGVEVVSNLNILTTVGSDTAIDKVLQDVQPVNGQIVITFAGETGTNADPNAKVAGAQVASQLYVTSSSLDDVGTFYIQLQALLHQAYAVDQAYPGAKASAPLEVRFAGNTVDGAVANPLFVLDHRADTQQSALMVGGNILRRSKITVQNTFVWLQSAAYIDGVDVCTVTGNQMLNSANSELRRSLMLVNSMAVAVTGNVFGGALSLPARTLSPTPPSPMDQWEFLNTHF
jgi:hypothetical protein